MAWRARWSASLRPTRSARRAGEIARSEKLLGNQGFVAKAPEAVVQRERDKAAELRERRDKLEARLRSLG